GAGGVGAMVEQRLRSAEQTRDDGRDERNCCQPSAKADDSVSIHPTDTAASERGGQCRENGDRLPTAGRLSREIPQAHATRELGGGSTRVLAFDPICAKNS